MTASLEKWPIITRNLWSFASYEVSNILTSKIAEHASKIFPYPELPAILGYVPLSMYNIRDSDNKGLDFSKDLIKQALPYLITTSVTAHPYALVAINTAYNIGFPAVEYLTSLDIKEDINESYNKIIDASIDITVDIFTLIAINAYNNTPTFIKAAGTLSSLIYDSGAFLISTAWGFVTNSAKFAWNKVGEVKVAIDDQIIAYKNSYFYKKYDDKFCYNLKIECSPGQKTFNGNLPETNQKLHDIYETKTFTPGKALESIVAAKTMGKFFSVLSGSFAGAAVLEGVKLYIEHTNPDSTDSIKSAEDSFPYQEFIKSTFNTGCAAAAISHAPIIMGVAMLAYYSHPLWPDNDFFKQKSVTDFNKMLSDLINLTVEDSILNYIGECITGYNSDLNVMEDNSSLVLSDSDDKIVAGNHSSSITD